MAKMTRTCVVCREKADKSQLLKFTAVKVSSRTAKPGERTHEAVLDSKQKMFGRSAYCHATKSCLSSPRLEKLIMSGLNKQRQASKQSRRIDRSSLESQIAWATGKFERKV